MDCSGHPSLTFRHWAGVSTYTSDFSLAGTCVCGKQSLGLLFCRRLQLQELFSSPAPAILLPKLRMHFAEFLNEGFPAHLRILSPPTCVGFGTGHKFLTRSFSRQCDARGFGSPKVAFLSALSLYEGDLPPSRPAAFDTLFQQRAHAFSCVTPLLKQNCQVQEYSPVVHRLCLLPRLRSRLTLSRRALLRNP